MATSEFSTTKVQALINALNSEGIVCLNIDGSTHCKVRWRTPPQDKDDARKNGTVVAVFCCKKELSQSETSKFFKRLVRELNPSEDVLVKIKARILPKKAGKKILDGQDKKSGIETCNVIPGTQEACC